MWSDDLVRVIIRAAEFWMICSLLMSSAGSPWSLVVLTKAVSVLCFERKPDWKGS